MTDSSALKSPLILEKVTKILNKKLTKSKAALVSSFSNHFYNSVSEKHNGRYHIIIPYGESVIEDGLLRQMILSEKTP